jgi:hypothetical protein
MISSSSFRQLALMRYLESHQEVEGWIHVTTAAALAEALWIQERQGVLGDVAEIGIHHGKSFIALALGMRGGEKGFAIDLFEKQHLNSDGSGYGNREKFLSNLNQFAPGTSVEIIAESSADIKGREEEYGLRQIRLFSIDGGHTADLTWNDLMIAESTIVPEGLCILDDVLNAEWTGVITGLFRYLAGDPELVPFAMFPNKLFLCRRDWHEFYRDRLRESFRFALAKAGVEFHNGMIDVYADRLR